MLSHLLKKFCIISSLNKNYIKNTPKNIVFIYRNYEKKIDLKEIIEFNKICKKYNKLFIIANEYKVAIKANLDGVYLPSFNKKINLNINNKKKFLILGSAHSIMEIKIKEKQGVNFLFISPLYKTYKSKKKLGVCKFRELTKHTKKKIVALGGINEKNLRSLQILKLYGYASISLFKKYENIKN